MCERTRSRVQALHAPHPLMLRGATSRRDAGRTSEDRMRHSGAVSDTIPRLCVTEVLSKIHLQPHSDVTTRRLKTQVCDGEVGARVWGHNARGHKGPRHERQMCKMHQQDAAQIPPITMCYPQAWGARDVVLKKIGGNEMRSGLVLLMSIVSRTPRAVNNVVWDTTAAQIPIHCRLN